MTHASLFSGIEGFGLAAAWAGINTVFSCEIDSFWREKPEFGLGEYRSYLCPSGVIGKEDLPEKWGLLWVDEDGNIIEIVSPQVQASNNFEEMQLAASLLRRNGITPKILDYKKYKTENI